MTALAGIVTNAASGRDIRRLVTRASVFPNAEKSAMVQRTLAALGAVGVERVLAMTDLGGIAAGVLRARQRGMRDTAGWPQVEFLDLPLTETAADTTAAVTAMVERGVGAIVVLGGDGTNRVVAGACGEVPIVSLSTGTNNVFPELREATVGGLAAGLVAAGRVDAETVCRRNKMLVVDDGGHRELALVDVCATTHAAVAARALWEADSLRALFVSFAEPDAIGLSAIAGLVQPVGRDEPWGLALDLAPLARARLRVRAPIAPGLVVDVGVDGATPMTPGERWPVGNGVIALDGEREIESSGAHTTVRLELGGPYTIDVRRTLRLAAENGLLRDGAVLAPP
ncbi:MAG: NAD(+)/NADH kinase [Actinomycetota bacterium]|nr:NAD(+)/NADH kinase [Actinomycetota bacterium]